LIPHVANPTTVLYALTACPLPPLNDPSGRWGDTAGAGTWDGQGAYGFTEPQTTDYIFHEPIVLRDLSWHGEIAAELDTAHSSSGYDPVYVFQVQADGSVTEVGKSLGTGQITPDTGRVQIDFQADYAQGTTQIDVGDTTGLSAGMAIHAYCDHDNTSEHVGGQLHVTTIASVDSGTTITLTDGLRIAATTGDPVCAFPATDEPTASDWEDAAAIYSNWSAHE
jgi:hypothetical protein